MVLPTVRPLPSTPQAFLPSSAKNSWDTSGSPTFPIKSTGKASGKASSSPQWSLVSALHAFRLGCSRLLTLASPAPRRFLRRRIRSWEVNPYQHAFQHHSLSWEGGPSTQCREAEDSCDREYQCWCGVFPIRLRRRKLMKLHRYRREWCTASFDCC